MDYFEFTRKDYENICKDAMLDEEYCKLLEYKIKGYSIVQISMKLGMSESTINRKLKLLKKKVMKVI